MLINSIGRIASCLIALGILIQPVPVLAQRELPLTVHTIKKDRLYWVRGGGGNSGIIIGDKGVVVVDAKISTEAGRLLLEAIAKLTSKPVTHIIETHSDGDHVNGVAAFPPTVKIIAHANNRNEQIEVPLMATVEIGGGQCIPPQDRLPNMVVYKDAVTTELNGDRIVLYHFGSAHTTGDIAVFLPDEKFVFAGDLLTYNVLIHPEKNGSLDGWFTAIDALLKIDASAFMPGHGDAPYTKQDIRKFKATVQSAGTKVDALVAAGKSLQDVKVAMGDPAEDRIGCRGIPYPSLTWVQYRDSVGRAAELK